MSRLKPLAPDEMNETQQQIYSEIAGGKRGTVPAPLQIWLRSPVLADRAQKLGEFVRYSTSLSPYLSELAILVTARCWTSQYEWFVHKKMALQAGVEPEIIEAIATNLTPDFTTPEARLIYDFSRALHQTHKVPDELYNRAVAGLGELAVVELVGLLGYYSLISMTLNAFEVEVPDGEAPELID